MSGVVLLSVNQYTSLQRKFWYNWISGWLERKFGPNFSVSSQPGNCCYSIDCHASLSRCHRDRVWNVIIKNALSHGKWGCLSLFVNIIKHNFLINIVFAIIMCNKFLKTFTISMFRWCNISLSLRLNIQTYNWSHFKCENLKTRKVTIDHLRLYL